jgi:hypothetical protein
MSVNARVVLLVGGRQDSIHGYNRINEKIDSHITENSTSLSAFGSIFENFWREPMSVNVRVVLLVGVRQDYVHAYQRKDRLSHY